MAFSMNSPIVSKNRIHSSAEVSTSFKSLKKSLKDTLERLESIGLNDAENPDEITLLKAQIIQKDKIIRDQALQIEKLNALVSLLSTNTNSSRINIPEPEESIRSSNIDQQISNQKAIFTNLYREIGQNLYPDFMDSISEYSKA